MHAMHAEGHSSQLEHGTMPLAACMTLGASDSHCRCSDARRRASLITQTPCDCLVLMSFLFAAWTNCKLHLLPAFALLMSFLIFSTCFPTNVAEFSFQHTRSSVAGARPTRILDSGMADSFLLYRLCISLAQHPLVLPSSLFQHTRSFVAGARPTRIY